MKQQLRMRQLQEVDIQLQRIFFISLKESTNYRETGNYFIPPTIGQMMEYLGWYKSITVLLFTKVENWCDGLWWACKDKLGKWGMGSYSETFSLNNEGLSNDEALLN